MDSVLLIVALGAVAAGFVQGLSGFGFGMVAMSFWAWALEPRLAALLAVCGALTGQLERSLNTVEVSGLRPPQDKPVVGISVAVQQFDAWPGNRASIAVTWRLSFEAGSAEEQLLTCRTQHQKMSQAGYPGLVATQQALMSDVASDIANSIKTRQCS